MPKTFLRLLPSTLPGSHRAGFHIRRKPAFIVGSNKLLMTDCLVHGCNGRSHNPPHSFFLVISPRNRAHHPVTDESGHILVTKPRDLAFLVLKGVMPLSNAYDLVYR